jgi:hypothetical protein
MPNLLPPTTISYTSHQVQTTAPKSILSKSGTKERSASLNKLIHSKTLTKIPTRDRLLATRIPNKRRRRRHLWSNATNVAWNIGERRMALASTYNPKRPPISGIRSAQRKDSEPLGNHDSMGYILPFVSTS